MRRTAAGLILGLALALPVQAKPMTPSSTTHAIEPIDIGLTAGGDLIEGETVRGRPASRRTLLVIGGLSRDGASVAEVRSALERYAHLPRRERPFTLIAIPAANPQHAALEFPPEGTAYRAHPVSFALWRWIGVHAPDLVLIAGPDPSGLAAALSSHAVAEVGRVPAHDGFTATTLGHLSGHRLEISPAHLDIDRREARTPLELARELARYYGHNFNEPIYIDAIALIAQLRLGHLHEVQALVQPYIDGERNSLAHPNSLVFAGHLIFGALARRTGDPRYTARVVAAANFGFEPDGHMKQAMPFNFGFSDSIFMGTDILVEAGALTGERKYFDMAARHVAYMQELDLRADGLYRHHPGSNVAWGRGNAFAAIGLALALAQFPHGHPAYARLLRSYRSLMAVLLRYQERDGSWRNVIDHPGAYREFSATAMIAFAMQRGLERGWLPKRRYAAAVQRAWHAVLARVGPDGRLVNVCASTARASTLKDYLDRPAILGQDPRGGAMAMLLATELAGLGSP